MNKIGLAISHLFYKSGYLFKKHSPQILTASGIACIAYGTYRVARDSKKFDPVIEDFKVKRAEILEKKKDPSYTGAGKELAHLYLGIGKEALKIFVPGFGFVTFGTYCLLKAKGLIQDENAALAADAYASRKLLGEYRGRVRNEVGAEKERQLYLGGRPQLFEETHEDENGNQTTEVKTGYVYEPDRLPSDVFPMDPWHSTLVREGDPTSLVEILISKKNTVLQERKQRTCMLTLADIKNELGFKCELTKRDYKMGQVLYEGVPLDQQPAVMVVGYDTRTKVTPTGEYTYKVPLIQIPVDGNVLDKVFGEG